MPANNTLTTLPPLVDLTDAQIIEAARAAGEPEWMIEQRAAAWRFFSESTPPFWRRTDLSKFQPEIVAAPLGVQQTTLYADGLAAQGVVFTTLAAALRDHQALVQRYFGTAVDPLKHKFSALHTALWQDGVFLYVPKGVRLEQPLLATFTLPEGGNAIFPHTLIIVDRDAQVTFIEEFSSPDATEQALAAPVTELFVGDGASVRFVTAQTWGAGVYHIGSQTAKIGHDGALDWLAVNLGGQVQHIEAETQLEGDGSRVDWLASTFANGSQSLLTAPWLRHVGANTEAHMDFKTVVDESGYTTFDGMIKIEHESRGTISRLEEHAIHLSGKARSDSIPGLKIETNDVQRAGHASTSGQVDEEQLFYMLSRGIKRDDAIHLIVMGFFEPVLDRLPPNELRERISAAIEAKI